MYPMRRLRVLPLILALGLSVSACSSDSTGPTPIVVEQLIEIYSGPLDPGGTNTYLFSLSQPATVQVMLGGVIGGDPLQSLSPVLHLTLARWSGSGCEPVSQLDLAPRLTAALQAYVEVGTYCAIVSDPHAALTGTVAATLRVVSPALVRQSGSAGTATFANTLTPAGRSSRTFVASAQGTVSLTLESFSDPDVELGLGLGLLASDGSGCRLAQIVHARPGSSPQLTARVDAGDYCAMVFDLGTLARTGSFTMRIAYP